MSIVNPYAYYKTNKTMSMFSQFSIPDLERIVYSNPSLRGIIQGYLAEDKLMQDLVHVPGITAISKIPDQDLEKGDIKIVYLGEILTIEVKSIATDSIREDILNDTWKGIVKVKNSDRRKISIDESTSITSTHLVKGGFDILAISYYAVSGEWDCLFMDNEYLPEISSKLPRFIKTSFSVNPETTPGVTSDLIKLLDSVRERKLLNNS